MKQKLIVRSLAAAGLIAALGAGAAVVERGAPHTVLAQSAPQSTAVAAPAAQARTPAGLPDFTRIVDQNGAAVVNISVVQEMKKTAGGPGFQMDPDDPMFEFFRRFGIPQQQNPGTPQPRQGLGSGFIVSPDGLVLTNAHVVQGASEVTVKLTDRRELKAKVIGVDAPSDIAVLKIEGRNFPVVRLGAADSLRVGEWVVAIGSPFGFENSVTSGIVSAKSRSLPDGGAVPFVQTDVAVNPGNSGGPLFNLNGEVVGINSQIYSRSGGYQGVSFAIPIETALYVKDQLVQHGKVTRGRIGVAVQEVNQSLASSFGMPAARGALVSSVEPGSPAEKAGIKAGDVVLKLNDTDIGSSVDLASRVSTMKPGANAKLEVWRDGKPREMAVRVGEAPAEKVAANEAPGDLSNPRIGVAVRSLTPEEQKGASVQGGLLVEQASGAAAKAGIQSGDIILAVNGTPVTSAGELKAAARSRKSLALLVQRGNARIFVPVQVG